MDYLFVKIFLPVFCFLYIKVTFVWPTLRVWRTTGINAFIFGKEDNVHNYVGKWSRILVALIIVCITIFIAGDAVYQYIMPVPYLEYRWLRIVSIVFCFISLLTTMLGHFDMAQSWRIGIDKINEAPLVQTGLFRFSRNPVFLSMIVILICIFFLMPNAITLVILVSGYILIQLQVRLEEEFLLQKHGEIYKRYCEKVRRWF